MSQDRIKRLNELGFVWNKYEAQWQLMLGQLGEYKGKHGHCLVPREYGEGKPKLGIWVHTQRTHYAKLQNGKPATMTEDRINQLDELGFVWKVE